MSTLTNLPGKDVWVGFPFSNMGGMASWTSASSFTTSTFDAANDSVAVIFTAPRTGDIFDVEFPLTDTAFSGQGGLPPLGISGRVAQGQALNCQSRRAS